MRSTGFVNSKNKTACCWYVNHSLVAQKNNAAIALARWLFLLLLLLLLLYRNFILLDKGCCTFAARPLSKTNEFCVRNFLKRKKYLSSIGRTCFKYSLQNILI